MPFKKVANQKYDVTCFYLVSWNEGIHYCDLNKEFDLGPFDVVVLSGVLEYVNDVPEVLAQILSTSKSIIASYNVGPDLNDIKNGQYLSILNERANNGWRNYFSVKEFGQICGRVGVIEDV